MLHFPKPRRVLEVGFRIIFYPTKQRSVLEKLTLRIPAMQSGRNSASDPNLFSDIAVAIQLMQEKGVSVDLVCSMALCSPMTPGKDHQLPGPCQHLEQAEL